MNSPENQPLDHATRCLITDSQGQDHIDTAAPKRLAAVQKQELFRQSIAAPSRSFDEIDRMVGDELDELAEVPPWQLDSANRRKGSDLKRLFSVLDSLTPGIGNSNGEAG